MGRLYFDNAATSFPKPPGVLEAVTRYISEIGASAGRGAYREASESRKILDRTREAVRRLFNCEGQDEVLFAFNGTDANNIALKGLLEDGDHVLTTVMDHNSILRPLSALHEQRGVKWNAIEVDPQTTLLDPDAIRRNLTPKTRLVVVNHASNVTGAIQPIADVARICREHGVLCMVDAAQSAGHLPIDFSALGVDVLTTPGHKGLMGPLGTGLLVLRSELAAEMTTYREGGTGSESEFPVQPTTTPDKFESGSHNGPGIAGLLAALEWILDRGIAAMRAHEVALVERMMGGLSAIAGVTSYGPQRAADRVGVFSVRVEGCEPHEVSAMLETNFGVLTRSGLYCAPLAHRAIGTDKLGGATRLSMGAMTSEADVDIALSGLAAIAGSA